MLVLMGEITSFLDLGPVGKSPTASWSPTDTQAGRRRPMCMASQAAPQNQLKTSKQVPRLDPDTEALHQALSSQGQLTCFPISVCPDDNPSLAVSSYRRESGVHAAPKPAHRVLSNLQPILPALCKACLLSTLEEYLPKVLQLILQLGTCPRSGQVRKDKEARRRQMFP